MIVVKHAFLCPMSPVAAVRRRPVRAVVDVGFARVVLWRYGPRDRYGLRQVGSGPWRRGPHAVTTRWRGVRTLHAGHQTTDELFAMALGKLATPCHCPACRR